MLDVDNLGCTRGDRPLFRGLSFALAAGEALYIAGRNGSGKTTLLRTLCGLSRPAEGEIRWNGRPIHKLGDEYHLNLGYVGHHNGLQGELTPEENLRHAMCLAGRVDNAAIEAMLAQLGLTPYGHLSAKLLSQGQKRRLALARLFVLNKPLWILDEPFTALDVQSIGLMETLVRQYLERGGMLLITSHQQLPLEQTTVRRIEIGVAHVRN